MGRRGWGGGGAVCLISLCHPSGADYLNLGQEIRSIDSEKVGNGPVADVGSRRARTVLY